MIHFFISNRRLRSCGAGFPSGSSVTSGILDSFTSAVAFLAHARDLSHLWMRSDSSGRGLGVRHAGPFRTAERRFLRASSSKAATGTPKDRCAN